MVPPKRDIYAPRHARETFKLKQASEHYFHWQEFFVTSCNKAKQGAPIVHDSKPAAGEFLLIAPERDPAATNCSSSARETRSSGTRWKLVRWVSHSTQALVSFARQLADDWAPLLEVIRDVREMISQPPDWAAPPWQEPEVIPIPTSIKATVAGTLHHGCTLTRSDRWKWWPSRSMYSTTSHTR